jgi:hypothetical protein
VRRPIIFPDVRLEFDDLPDPAFVALAVTDEPSSQQTPRRLERRQGDD